MFLGGGECDGTAGCGYVWRRIPFLRFAIRIDGVSEHQVYLLLAIGGLAAIGVTWLIRRRQVAERNRQFAPDGQYRCGQCGQVILKGAPVLCPQCRSDLYRVGLVWTGNPKPLPPRSLFWSTIPAALLLCVLLGVASPAAQPFSWLFTFTERLSGSFASDKPVRMTVYGKGRYLGTTTLLCDILVTPDAKPVMADYGRSILVTPAGEVPLVHEQVEKLVADAFPDLNAQERKRTGEDLWSRVKDFGDKGAKAARPGVEITYSPGPMSDGIVMLTFCPVLLILASAGMSFLASRLREDYLIRSGTMLPNLVVHIEPKALHPPTKPAG